MEQVNRFDLNEYFSPNGGDAKPNLLFKREGLKTLYLYVPPGMGMPVHDHPGCQVTLIGMQGQANVVVNGVSHPLLPGELITFSGEHRVEPRNDSTEPCGVLITLAQVADPC